TGIFPQMLHLEALGVLSGSAGLIHYQPTTDAHGRFQVRGEKYTLVGLTDPNIQVPISATPLTRVGQELLKIVPNKDEMLTIRKLAEWLREPVAFSNVKIRGAALAENLDGKVRLVELLWGDSPFDGDWQTRLR
ncbi:MAG TPA: hypothetical protein VFK50_09975, partial [Sphingomicrobium sp.]|nr:hypothetical protein [Sphingomicrobium sp.]